MYEPWYNMGNIYLKKKDWPNAVKAYTKASELNSLDAYVLNNLGVAYEKQLDYKRRASLF